MGEGMGRGWKEDDLTRDGREAGGDVRDGVWRMGKQGE